MKHGYGAAEVRQMADAALGEIGVVHQEHIAGLHRVRRKVAHDAIGHRRIGSPRELAAITVEQPDAKIMCFADHRRPRGAFDGEFDFGLDRIQRAFDDLQHDRIDRCTFTRRGGRPRMTLVMEVHRIPSGGRFKGRMTRIPCGSTSTYWPGNSTVVEPNSSTIAGPSIRPPDGSDARSYTGVS